ncbi:unnamed protein product [Prunus armeniaca]
MSSPKTRAKGSSSSLSPPYISGTGVDKHAIEIRSKLHSKYLSRSYPSSEVRNNTVKWSDWIDRLFLKYGAHWKRAGIYDAILLSKQSVNRDENLLAAALCFWNSASNTFDFRPSPMSPTLLHMAQIFGFMPYGRPANAIGDYHRRKNGEKVAKKFTISSTALHEEVCCTVASGAQKKLPLVQAWVQTFEVPEDEAAKIDFRKKFLNVMLTRDLTFGGGKPPNSHLGGEVYQPN